MNKTKYTPKDYLTARAVQITLGWNGDQREVTIENYEDLWEEIEEGDEDGLSDSFYEIREMGEDTNIACKSSRHYESQSVALKCWDKWVGFTYWSGGGKHGEPYSIPWAEESYFLDVTEEEVVVTKRTFTKQK